MPINRYRVNGVFWSGSGACQNDSPLHTFFNADDAREPFTGYTVFQANTGCPQGTTTNQSFGVGIRDKNNVRVTTEGGCFNAPTSGCGKLGSSPGITITKLGLVYYPGDPGYPTTPTKYACINGVCVLASQGIYDTVEQCQQTGCQAPGSPERPLSELCPEGESCDQNSTCVSNQDLNNWIQAINDMKTVIQG